MDILMTVVEEVGGGLAILFILTLIGVGYLIAHWSDEARKAQEALQASLTYPAHVKGFTLWNVRIHLLKKQVSVETKMHDGRNYFWSSAKFVIPRHWEDIQNDALVIEHIGNKGYRIYNPSKNEHYTEDLWNRRY